MAQEAGENNKDKKEDESMISESRCVTSQAVGQEQNKDLKPQDAASLKSSVHQKFKKKDKNYSKARKQEKVAQDPSNGQHSLAENNEKAFNYDV